MSLNASLGIASSGLAAIEYEMAVASQNVSNATTAGYAEETASVSSRSSAGVGGGVLVGVTTREVNNALEAGLYTQNAVVSAASTTSNTLAPITALQGSTSADAGSSNTLSDSLGNLQAGLIALESTPSSAAQQQSVVADASTLTSDIRNIAGSYQTQRQASQDAIVDNVSTANSSLALIGSLSNQIGALRVQGLSSADLENQRAAAMTTLSNVLSVQFKETSDGDMLVSTANGLALPAHATSGPLTTTDATVGVGSSYPANIPAITIAGRDVTSSLTGGSLGANIVLRDQTLPTMQAQLDSFSTSLAARFDAQGVTLFSDSNQVLPTGTDSSGVISSFAASGSVSFPPGQVGFANVIQVNPQVISTPSTLQTGTAASTTVAADDTTVIDNLLNFALGTNSQTGVAQPAATSTGLGLAGNLSTGYSGSTDIISMASTLTATQAGTISQATTSLTNETDVQTALSSKVSAVSAVSVDTEMSSIVSLQNAYTANAKVVAAVQSMFSALLSAVS